MVGRSLRVGSLFSGIGGFDLGFEQAGLEVVWQIENDRDCNRILDLRFPTIPKLGDIQEVKGEGLEAVDLICGGFPCQDVSVAGQRAGLAGARSGLWWEFHRLLAELRPPWAVIENVPGLLSSQGGRDFALVLRGLEELGYHVVWRTLDAQYFGVPQIRRRPFLVGYLGDYRAVEVLFEPESLQGNLEEGGLAWEEVAGALRGGSPGGSRHGKNSAGDQQIVAVPLSSEEGEADLARTLGSLSEGGFRTTDLDQIGTFVFEGRVARNDRGAPSDLVPPLKAQSGSSGKGDGAPLLAGTVNPKWRSASGGPAGDERRGLVAVPLRSRSSPNSNTPGRGGEDDENLVVVPVLAISENQRAEVLATEISRQLVSGGGKPGSGYPAVAGDFGIRRLTPLECERLQGFPDHWTAELSDTGRYRVLGNAVCVPVARWLGERIKQWA